MRGKITVVGLGPGRIELIPLQNWEVLRSGQRIYLRTGKHPAVDGLRERGISFTTLDKYYEESQSFEECYSKLVDKILAEAKEAAVVYGVPGHPLVAEETVNLLKREALERKYEIEIMGAMSFLEVLFTTLGIDPVKGLKVLDGLQLNQQVPSTGVGNVITQVYSSLVASEVKLNLMEYYPDDKQVIVVQAAGVPGLERVVHIPLYELDRLPWVDHLTTVYVPPEEGQEAVSKYPMDSLVNALAALRGPEGCPWDKEQTHRTLKSYLIEEAYEVLEAIDEGDSDKICEELGDVLLQIALHAQIARENEYFDINDVILEITEKMIRRHPHVFGQAKVKNSQEVTSNWEEIKAREKEAKGERQLSILDGIPKSLPALLKAEKIQKKVAKVGFDWPDYRGAWEKVYEELKEVAEVLAIGDMDGVQEELGDVFFAVTNLCRHLSIDSEASLNSTNHKFIKRFQYIEEEVRRQGKTLEMLSLQELDQLWNRSKEEKRQKS
ncbi:MAG: nucleoside triphosphate pyrophosphohydrolase [Clostridia bacterium]|nr:nucleoside triphosphate pyrophosphohydrolase [Clostridia bacterium]